MGQAVKRAVTRRHDRIGWRASVVAGLGRTRLHRVGGSPENDGPAVGIQRRVQGVHVASGG